MAIPDRANAKYWIAAVLIPFAAQALILTADKDGGLYKLSPWKDPASFALVTVGISSMSGFVFLLRPFRLRSAGIALAYFPIMGIALFLFSFVFGSVFLNQAQ